MFERIVPCRHTCTLEQVIQIATRLFSESTTGTHVCTVVPHGCRAGGDRKESSPGEEEEHNLDLRVSEPTSTQLLSAVGCLHVDLCIPVREPTAAHRQS
jgi:hypothetical protein